MSVSSESALQAVRLQLRQIDEDILNEKRDMNEFQQQKEQIEKYWLLMKSNRDEIKLDQRQKLREKQDQEEKHAFEQKIYKQKVKHLLHENQQLSGIDIYQNADVQRAMESTHQHVDQEQKDELFELNNHKSELLIGHYEAQKDMRIMQDKRITALREEYSRRAAEAKEYYEQVLSDRIYEMEIERKSKVSRLEGKLKSFTAKLVSEHQNQLRDLQTYYREIKYVNLSFIKTQKEDVSHMLTSDEKLKREVAGLSRQNNKQKQPLQANQEKLKILAVKLAQYHDDQQSLKEVGDVVRGQESKVYNLEWEQEVMLQRVARIKQENEAVKEKLNNSIQRVRASAKFREVLTEKKVVAAAVDVEKTSTAVHEIAIASGIEEIDSDIKDSLEAVLVAKNLAIQHLEKMLVGIRQNHRMAIESFEAKLYAHNIPIEALGFQPNLDF